MMKFYFVVNDSLRDKSSVDGFKLYKYTYTRYANTK